MVKVPVELPRTEQGQVFLILRDPIVPFLMFAEDKDDCRNKLISHFGQVTAMDMEIKETINVYKL